ncbi:sigma-70 family RNA polymerase sigma factor [Aminipila terrae]|uniref:Sigma-70 family RNA polymerase sigma factor n=1 Tax=Aminipila terrae TaxID=2697030 RepID=A0A6P1MC53_9FIRM|nr:sigma-70 family RNA polymerase sigma factor [Aminipila terrae]QHI71602.1 sigma-70 family RNA polymerase sigma factor [Aminipila terrae]
MRKKENFYKIAFSYVKNEQDALDVIQEATCRAYTNIKSLKNPEFFNTWFVRILINTAISTLRKNKKYVQMNHDEQVIAPGGLDESYYDLVKALDLLDMKYKSIILLKFYEDMTFKQIGEVLNKPESTIKTNYYRAMGILKGHLDYERV